MRYILLLLPLLLMNCLKTNIIYGTGTLSTTTVALERFNGTLNLNINTPITITQGEPQLTITTDENLHKYILWDSTDGSLSISQSRDFKLTSTELTVNLTLPLLSELTIDSNRVISTVQLDTAFVGIFRGNSEFVSDISLAKASLSATESAVMEFTGDVSNLSLLITSDKKQRLDSLEITHTDIEIATSKLTSLNVRSSITGILAGEGDLSLRIHPPLEDLRLFGSGVVTYADTLLDSTILDTTSLIVPNINEDSLARLDSIAIADSLAVLDSIALADSLALLDSTDETTPRMKYLTLF